jgi:hypothetical protein
MNFRYLIRRSNEFSQRALDFCRFTEAVVSHIEEYTVPQYGDKGKDLATDYTSEYCIEQIKKYCARYGKNSRPNQELRDLYKMAHFVQLLHLKTTDKLNVEKTKTGL